ncbi:Emopamil-binding protein, partial [Russula dissimulans]
QDRATFIWLTFDPLNHFVLKTPFIVMSTFGHTVNTSSGIFAAIWRTYAVADTRWGTADPTIVSVVLPTVLVVAPFAVLIVYQIVKRDPTRYYWIVILSIVELYGAWMVFCPEWLIGSPHLNTSNPSNFWVLVSSCPIPLIWVIVDVLLLYDSYVNIAGSLDFAQ